MYLFIHSDNTICQCVDNLMKADILATTLKPALLKIIRFSASKNRFEQLCVDNAKLIWIPVKECKYNICSDGAIHT